MKKSKEQLTSEDKEYIQEAQSQISPFLKKMERAKSFKVGDFLILKTGDMGRDMAYGTPIVDNEPNLTLLTNSYGAPIKYVVVHLDENGMAYVKRVNKNGSPYGPVSSCMGVEDDDYARHGGYFVFELDPDFADSLLLEDTYDPTSLHRSKKDIWKAVTEHNKKHKIVTKELYDVVSFFRSAKPGDTYWTSNTNSFFVKAIEEQNAYFYNRGAKPNLHTIVITGQIPVITIIGKNGKEQRLPPDFFWGKALYRERPRTYRELNI